ncbi:MAG: hypothetical protein AAF447_02590 [Myxococcota bacterium]
MRRLRLHGPARIRPGSPFRVSLELDPRAGVPRVLTLRLTRSRRLLGDNHVAREQVRERVLEREVARDALAEGHHALSLRLPRDVLPSHEGFAGWVRYALSLSAPGGEPLVRPVLVEAPADTAPHERRVLEARPSDGSPLGFRALLPDGVAHLGGVLTVELRLHYAALGNYRRFAATLSCIEGGIETVQWAEHLGEERLRLAHRRLYLPVPRQAAPSRARAPEIRWRLALRLETEGASQELVAVTDVPVLGTPPPWTAPPLVAARGEVRAWVAGRLLRLRFPSAGPALDFGPASGATRGLPRSLAPRGPLRWRRAHRLRGMETPQGEALLDALLAAGLADFHIADGWESGLDLVVPSGMDALPRRAGDLVDALVAHLGAARQVGPYR